MRVYRFHRCSQKVQMQLWWSAAENWLSKVDPTPAFWLARRVTIISGAYPVLPASSLRTRPGQLRLWKVGIGPSTDGGATMMAIAQKLSDEDIKAVASYFETLPRE
jgi:hypothetical protein